MLDLLLNGLAIGSMYAMGTVALSMIWGSLGILNMAHGAILTIGAYASYVVAAQLGLPWWAGAGAAALAGVACGTLLYHSVVRWLFDKPNAPINVIIATIAVGALAENVITVGLSAEPRLQPFSFDGSFQIASPDGRFFAQVLMDRPGQGTGWWNETPFAGHAHSPLGKLRRDDACWVNQWVSVCAW